MRKQLYIICFAIIINLGIGVVILAGYANKISITSFSFEVKNNPQLKEDLIGKINGQRIIVEVPDKLDISGLIASYSFNGSYLEINGQYMNEMQENYERDILCTVYRKDRHIDYTVHVVRECDIGKEITKFSFNKQENSYLQADVTCIISNNVITAYMPPNIKDFNLIATFETTGYKVFTNQIEQISGENKVDYSKAVNFTVLGNDGKKKEYAVNIETINTGLPSIAINISENMLPVKTDNYSNGSIVVYDRFHKPMLTLKDSVDLRIRGNTTANEIKKGYNILFDQEVEILGLSKSKKYALIANYTDKTMLRHDIGYKLSHLIFDKTTYNPSGCFVDVFFNDNYIGCYYLSEIIEVSKDKVAANGLMVEGESRDKDKKFFSTSRGVSFRVKYPEEVFLIKDISLYIQSVEDDIYSIKSIEDTNINLKSLIDWYLVNEIIKNKDTRNMLSVFMFRGVDERLNFGPVWDFDLSSGNVGYDSELGPEGFWVKENPWISELLRRSDFEELVKARWGEVRPDLYQLFDYIDLRKKDIEKSVQCNYVYWDISDTTRWSSSKRYFNYESSVDDLKKWLKLRIDWLDNQWNEGKE